jgi:hypothetical protein
MENKRKETLSEQKLRQEYEAMQKRALHVPGAEDRIDERQYFTPGSAGLGRGRSVNTLVDDYAKKYGGLDGTASTIKPAEALEMALSRTLNSGAPVNNMGFYDEVNWHLQTLGTSTVQPIAIKEALGKMVKRGRE